MTKQIQVDPLAAAAANLTAQQTSVELSRKINIMDGNGKVERRQWHIHQLKTQGGKHKSWLRYTLRDYPGKRYARNPLRTASRSLVLIYNPPSSQPLRTKIGLSSRNAAGVLLKGIRGYK